MSMDAAALTATGRPITRAAAIAAPAALALLIAIVRTGQIPLWRDEYATAMFASLPAADLIAATTHVDAVIAPYYLLMHALSPVLGMGLGMRIVSILAFAGTAAVIATVAQRWWGPIAGATAGLAVALNGEALGAAVNARPYALSLLFGALAILFADKAIRSGSRGAWIGYAAATGAAVALQLFAILAVAAIAVLVVGSPRSTLVRWAIASVPALATAGMLLLVGLGHRGQLVWLGPPDLREALLGIARSSGVSADRAVVVDTVALVVLSVAGALSILAARCARASPQSAVSVRTRVFAATLMLGPPAVLFALSWTVTPVFTGKYFVWSSLGAALLLGGAVALLAPPRRRAGIVAAMMAAALLVLSGGVTGARLLNPPPRGDDFPAAAHALEDSAEIGDTLVIAQPYAFGGVAYGFAVSAGDDAQAREVRERAVSGSQPVLDTRTITGLAPLRTAAATVPPSGNAASSTWVMTIFPLTEAQIAAVDPALGGCLDTIEFESPTERFGALRLFQLECG